MVYIAMRSMVWLVHWGVQNSNAERLKLVLPCPWTRDTFAASFRLWRTIRLLYCSSSSRLYSLNLRGMEVSIWTTEDKSLNYNRYLSRPITMSISSADCVTVDCKIWCLCALTPKQHCSQELVLVHAFRKKRVWYGDHQGSKIADACCLTTANGNRRTCQRSVADPTAGGGSHPLGVLPLPCIHQGASVLTRKPHSVDTRCLRRNISSDIIVKAGKYRLSKLSQGKRWWVRGAEGTLYRLDSPPVSVKL